MIPKQAMKYLPGVLDICIKPNPLQYDMPPSGAQTNWNSQVFRSFLKAKKMGMDLTLRSQCNKGWELEKRL